MMDFKHGTILRECGESTHTPKKFPSYFQSCPSENLFPTEIHKLENTQLKEAVQTLRTILKI